MTSSASSPTETSTETILVVDDDSEVLSVAEDMLRSMRYSVIGTMDPYVALRFARTHPNAIHLLLTDVVMPLELSDLRGAASLVQPMAPRAPRLRVAQRPRALSSPRTWMP